MIDIKSQEFLNLTDFLGNTGTENENCQNVVPRIFQKYTKDYDSSNLLAVHRDLEPKTITVSKLETRDIIKISDKILSICKDKEELASTIYEITIVSESEKILERFDKYQIKDDTMIIENFDGDYSDLQRIKKDLEEDPLFNSLTTVSKLPLDF